MVGTVSVLWNERRDSKVLPTHVPLPTSGRCPSVLASLAGSGKSWAWPLSPLPPLSLSAEALLSFPLPRT